MKKLLVLLAALVMVLSFTACGAESGADNTEKVMISVAIEIDYPDDTDLEDVEATMTVEEGTSAMEQLYAYADQNGIEVVLDESSPTIYVTSINGVEQTDSAGWVYEVNDEMTMDAADELLLTEGMKISWEYTSWGDM